MLPVSLGVHSSVLPPLLRGKTIEGPADGIAPLPPGPIRDTTHLPGHEPSGRKMKDVSAQK